MTKYKMLGDIEQGIHYTSFTEDVEDAQDKKEIGKSHGETKNAKMGDKQSVLSDEGTIL